MNIHKKAFFVLYDSDKYEYIDGNILLYCPKCLFLVNKFLILYN